MSETEQISPLQSPAAPAVNGKHESKGRIQTIDALRGIAALTVTWFHVTNQYSAEGFVRKSGHYGWVGVETFFVVSGFIILYALHRRGYQLRRHWGVFVMKRIIRLDPPYFVAAAGAAVLWYASAMAPGFQGEKPNLTLVQFLSHVGYLNGILDVPWLNPAFWTLALEFQFYLLVSLLFPLLASANGGTRRAGLALVCASSFLIPSEVFVFHYLCLFSLGMVTFQYYTQLIGKVEYTILIIGITALVAVAQQPLIAVVGMASALLILLGKFGTGRVFVFFGAISYSLYLVHIPIGGRVVNLGQRFVDTEPGNLCLSLIAVAVSIVAAYVLFRWVEKPAQKWSSSLKFKHKDERVPGAEPKARN